MINNGKKVFSHPVAVLSKEFQNLISRALAASEFLYGQSVAAPTAGASASYRGFIYFTGNPFAEDRKFLRVCSSVLE